ncbi:MAG: Tetratricopeptide repeat protein [Candidatus Methanoperedenaceae archaeon GB37]|nr:Tetratricopeptide repeat protein [Candidatus Methanoperedenaceae archaeon GB37]CAD7783783.1 MAG: Tetratricopeptide repeat protein [Candidatus Methanoperedenaceae archaeon GB37]
MYDAWYNLGVAYNKIDKLNEAIEAYKKAIKIKPDMHEAWCNLGVAYDDLGKFNEAIKAYKKAIEIKPDYPYACANLAHTLGEKNKISEGVKFIKKAIFLAKKEKDPGFPKAEFLKRESLYLLHLYLLLSSKAFKRGNYPKVISYLEEALKIVSQAEPAPAGEEFSTYLKGLIKMADADFSIKILKLIKEKGTEDLKEFLKPFMIALSYLEKKDEMILLRTPEEFKTIVKEILSEINKGL